MNWPAIAGAFACVCAGFITLVALLVFIQRAIVDGRHWRKLVKIAGSEEAALLVVEQARMQRDLDDALLRKSFRAWDRRRATVTRLRVVNRGHPVRFEGPGDAA